MFILHNHAHETKLNSFYQGECHFTNKTSKFCTANLMSLVNWCCFRMVTFKTEV